MGIKVNFALPYRLRYEDKVQMLGQDGRDACDSYVAEKLREDGLDIGSPAALQAARTHRQAFIAGREERLRVDLTIRLIEVGVGVKFGKEMMRKDQRVWSRVQDAADDGAEIEFNQVDALWVSELFFGCARPKHGEPRLEPTQAWDKFAHSVARHLDVFEEMIERLARAAHGLDTHEDDVQTAE